MKFVKLSIFALTMGLFIASCGNGENKEAAKTDTAATAPAPEATPAAAPAATPADTTTAAAATPAADTAKKAEAAAPAKK